MDLIIELLTELLRYVLFGHLFFAVALTVAAGAIALQLGAPGHIAGLAMIGALLAYALAYAFFAVGRARRRAMHDNERP